MRRSFNHESPRRSTRSLSASPASTRTTTVGREGEEGYLHVFRPVFDEFSADTCLVAIRGSQLTGIEIPAGEAIIVVASTFVENDFIGDFTITVDVTQ